MFHIIRFIILRVVFWHCFVNFSSCIFCSSIFFKKYCIYNLEFYRMTIVLFIYFCNFFQHACKCHLETLFKILKITILNLKIFNLTKILWMYLFFSLPVVYVCIHHHQLKTYLNLKYMMYLKYFSFQDWNITSQR